MISGTWVKAMGNSSADRLNRQIDPYSVLVFTPVRLVRIYCPFYVMAIYVEQIPDLRGIQRVERVKVSDDLKLLYLFRQRYYYYRYFRILT